jgi:TatD DNase family protein
MIDFHCHIDLYPKPAAVRDECATRGLYVLCVTTTPSAWKGTTALIAGTARIRVALGLHPQLAHERRHELPLFDSLLQETRYIGEIGLDGGPEYRDAWHSQVFVFEHILTKCREMGGRVMSVHSRRASGAVLSHLERFTGAGTPVLHWFSGSFRDLDRAIDLGCWYSIGPAMLATDKGRSLAARMPRDRVLTESDGPFAQLDGETAMPWHVERAVDELSRIWSAPEQEVRETLGHNLRTLVSNSPDGA